jgi:hypothetical protein
MAFEYIQSLRDTPCTVRAESFGRSRTPLLSLSKWGEEASLLFKTGISGEKVRMIENSPGKTVLTTGKRQHVYRRLNAGNIEYDIVLPEIPDSPVFKIPLEKPRGLSFHRQGNRYGHLMNEEVRGSYAVYWNKRGRQYRTGKFCHIYRPRIIDATGRWIWGDLDYDGDALYITVDEEWLKKASYPVTVDPRLGSDSVGAGSYDFINSESGMPFVEMGMALQRVVPATPVAGACTAYYYSYKNDPEAGGFAALYDGGVPANLISSAAPFTNLRVPSGEDPSWKSSSFNIAQEQAAGSYLWFGLLAKYYYHPYFDEVGGANLRIHYPSGFDAPPASCGSTTLYSDILLSQYFDYINLTTWTFKVEDRSKPDEELFHEAEFRRQEDTELGLTETFTASRGMLRLISCLGGLSDSPLPSVFYQRTLSAVTELTDLFTRFFSSFICLVENWAVWDVFQSFRSHASEELVIYSPLCLSLELKSPI